MSDFASFDSTHCPTVSDLGALFVILSIVLAAVAGVSRQAATVDTSLVNQSAPAPAAPTPLQPSAPLADPTTSTGVPAATNGASDDNTAPTAPLAQ